MACVGLSTFRSNARFRVPAAEFSMVWVCLHNMPTRKKIWMTAVLITLLTWSAWALIRFDRRSSMESVEIRRISLNPEYRFSDRQGKEHKVGEYGGNWTLIHFWASWCAPCVSEIPELLQFLGTLVSSSNRNDDLKILMVSLDDSWAAADRVLKPSSLPANTVSVIDLSKGFPGSLGITKYPETLLVGPDRKIVGRWIGPQAWNDPAWGRALIERMRAHVR